MYLLSSVTFLYYSFLKEHVVSVAFFKCCVTQSNVCFFCLWSRDLCLIDDVPDITISLKWAGILVLVITVVVDFF